MQPYEFFVHYYPINNGRNHNVCIYIASREHCTSATCNLTSGYLGVLQMQHPPMHGWLSALSSVQAPGHCLHFACCPGRLIRNNTADYLATVISAEVMCLSIGPQLGVALKVVMTRHHVCIYLQRPF